MLQLKTRVVVGILFLLVSIAWVAVLGYLAVSAVWQDAMITATVTSLGFLWGLREVVVMAKIVSTACDRLVAFGMLLQEQLGKDVEAISETDEPVKREGTILLNQDGSVDFMDEQGNMYAVDEQEASRIRSQSARGFAEGICPKGCGLMKFEKDGRSMYCPVCNSRLYSAHPVDMSHN